ncbi:MAG: LysM peptidoglycan-binding domain-containing protein, partial [Anaerolineales bacterium]|nr:LysM peptidoglycan-binding domain-containing protein [Anaerolineales bacterium]
MKSNCPYLGIKDDPHTSLAYADPANYCQGVSPAEPVKLSHQGSVCLGGSFGSCPVNAGRTGYGPELRRLPPAIRGSGTSGATLRLPRGWLLLLLVIALVPLTFWLYSLRAPLSSSGAQSQETDGSAVLIGVTPSPTPNFTPTHINASLSIDDGSTDEVPTPTASPTLTLEPELVDEPAEDQPPPKDPVNCTHPKGWVVYIVRSGDTLFGIALSHGISTVNLKAANCLKGSSSVIRVGQRLYVPYTQPPPKPPATQPPAPTNTPIPVIPTDTL